ncbi:MAG: YdeI/OmpD-associated family protein [Candidatus Saccharimonadales bacterium]
MDKRKIKGGTVHEMPADLRNALMSDESVTEKWESLTPLARNEWICWNITVKQSKTREIHIKRTIAELLEGKHRPCCWIGCIHRKDKPISPSVQSILDKQSKSK